MFRAHNSSQKIPTKVETKALKQVLTAGSYERFSPPASPLINRRPISASTEAALRAACTALVNGTQGPTDDFVAKISDSTRASEDLLRGANGSSSHGKHSRKDSRQRLEDDVVPHPTKYSYKPDSALDQLLPATNHERRLMQSQQPFPKRRESLQSKSKSVERPEKPSIAQMNSMPEDEASDSEMMSPIERPKTAPFADSSDVSVSTPVSASTDRIFNNASTALTTAAVTPSRPSQRGSQNFVLSDEQYQAAVEQADAAAAEWMRKELEKRRQKQDREAQAAQQAQAQIQASQRPPSRNGRERSLSNSIKDYIRPRTASNSRPGSRNGLQQSDSNGPTRTPSQSQGWRSWGSSLQRKSSKSSIKDPRAGLPTSYSDTRLVGKQEVDLNRPLPALPSLDTYKDLEKTTTSTHIANLMRPKSKDPREAPKEVQARVVNIQKVKAVPQSLPKLQTEPSTIPLSPPQPRYDAGTDMSPSVKSHKFTSHSKSSSQDSCFSPASSGYPSKRSIDLMKAAERARSKSQENLRSRPRKDSSTSSTQAPPATTTAPRKVSFSTNAATTAPLPTSRPTTRGGTAVDPSGCPNFSRKISCDQPPQRNYDPRYPNVVEITALPPMPPKSKKTLTGLRKIVSQFSLHSQKRKEMGWMEYLEKDGVGGQGYMAHGAEAPVVRY